MPVLAHPKSSSVDRPRDDGAVVRRRYDRVARAYERLANVDLMMTGRWRRALWSRVEGRRVLEVGVGAGINMLFYPPQTEITAFDIAPKMIEAARRRSARLGVAVDLEVGDVQELRYGDQSFDTVIATFVFCSVPDPIRGLRELRRVLRPGGRLLLLEHVVSRRKWLASVMRVLDPLVARICGAHIARDTVANVQAVGFANIVAMPVCWDIVQTIDARAPLAPP